MNVRISTCAASTLSSSSSSNEKNGTSFRISTSQGMSDLASCMVSLPAMPKNESSKPWWMLPAGRVSSWWWAAAVVLMVGLDYEFALDVRLPSLHVLPVLAAAWYTGAWCAAVVAVVLVAVQAAFVLVRTTPDALTSALLVLTAVRGMVILLLGLWFARLAE